MNYKKINLSKDRTLDFSKLDSVIDTKTDFWKRLELAGGQLKGTEDIFPAVFNNGEVRKITYQVRRGSTESGGLDLGGYTYLNAYEDPSHKFWKEVNLPSPPELWGVFSCVVSNGKILLGRKKAKTMNVSAVFGTMLDNIGGGIVDIEDYQQCKTFTEALKFASKRELGEESPGTFSSDNLKFNGIIGFFDPDRVKQDAMVVWNLVGDRSALVFPSESEEFESFEFYALSDIDDKTELSPHAQVSFENIGDFLK